MGGLFIVPLPIAIPLILLVLALMPFIPVSWPVIIVIQFYRGKRDERPPREVRRRCLKGIAWSFGIPCITILVLWIMCIVQVVLVVWWAVGLCWRARDIDEWKRLGRQIGDLPREIQNLWLRLQVWGRMKMQDNARVGGFELGVVDKRKELKEEEQEKTKAYAFKILHAPTSIRLLSIFPAEDYMAPLRGEIRAVDLRANPSYDALSYTWADEDGEIAKTSHVSVVFNPKKGTYRQLRIGRNCELAMRRLRRKDRKRTVWIDAVCINQADLEERSQQVKLMSRIFVSARQVVVYTGEGTPQTDGLYDWLNDIDAEKLSVPSGGLFSPQSALQFYLPLEGVLGRLQEVSNEVAIRLEDMGRLIRGYAEKIRRMLRELRMVYHLGIIPRRPPEPHDLHRVLKEYFSRRWFKRVWVLQEVSLPEMKRIRVLCGNRVTTGERAMHLLSMLVAQGQDDIDVGRLFVLLRQKPVGATKRSSQCSHLLDLLIETKNRQCEDPRDKIFGVLNIAHWLDGVGAGREELDKVSYFAPVAEVYAAYSALLIRRHGPGFFLSLIKSSPAIQGLPSWAADWTVAWPNSKALYGSVNFSARSRFASEKDKALEFDPENKVMKILRPRIVRGFFAWTGQSDGEHKIHTVEVKQLDREEVLVEIYPGLAMLLRQYGEDWTFVKACPHALDKPGVERLVANWSRTVVHQENPGRIQDMDEGAGGFRSQSPRGYLGKTRVWKIV
ncbi:heterokaryon incompatibility protein-domain-containing protein [Triangularia verruculosa]|uniref:Heterokaryon incompatibility protein-domain-containing protein n=1 Tax=Triangularia verruculosa TaxID=2587418 RepID=A0AAN6X7L6_9PEZI|nr:heterokaryon incompatibility protein-domain-containing protein [Triangularia verruculosa]